MKKLIYLMVMSFIIISITFAGIKKGNITTDTSFSQQIRLPDFTITNNIYQRIETVNNIFTTAYSYYTYYSSEVIGTVVRGGSFDPYYEYVGSRLGSSSTSYIGRTVTENISLVNRTVQVNTYHLRTDVNTYEEGDIIVQSIQDVYQRDITTTETFRRDIITTDNYLVTQEIVNQYVLVVDPLIIDLDGDGIPDVSGGSNLPKKSFDRSRAILFDLNADGIKDFVEWIGSKDGLIVFFENNKYKEDVNGFNLMSNAFGYENGFEKLAENFDFNKDNKITGEELENLYIWQDKNSDGKIQRNELKTFNEIGVVEIGTVYGKNSLEGYAKTKEGKMIKVWQWWPSIEWGIGKK